jgi:hypothetical protein
MWTVSTVFPHQDGVVWMDTHSQSRVIASKGTRLSIPLSTGVERTVDGLGKSTSETVSLWKALNGEYGGYGSELGIYD